MAGEYRERHARASAGHNGRVRGVLVVGTGLDSGEILVATVAARVAGEESAAFATTAIGDDAEAQAALVDAANAAALRTAASPVIAARHAGTELDPARLVEAAREAAGELLLVAAAPGGLMAPITENYSNRDFARELGVPLVIAARATGGVTGQVRLVAEAARAAGLAHAATVLTGWPDPPSRVQLDERDLLEKTGRAPVFTLADGGAGGDVAWPVAEWANTGPAAQPDAAAAAQPAEAAGPAPIVLDPYEAWKLRDVGDPRSTPRPQIMDVMLEILLAEGPMTASRAYSLYNRASGGRKLTSVARAPLSSAAYWLAREGKLTLTREADIPWQGDDVLRLPDQPPVRVRELGPRDLDEVPLDEIAELVGRMRANGTTEATELKRTVLSTYGLKRLTAHADEYLGLAIDLAG
jgi:dethiobiotin synthetase